MLQNDLSNIFKNVTHKHCSTPGYDFAFDITENGKFLGELFYSEDSKEWFFIKDNYPHPRKGYRISFPINTKEFIVEVFKTINIDLIEA